MGAEFDYGGENNATTTSGAIENSVSPRFLEAKSPSFRKRDDSVHTDEVLLLLCK